MDRKYKTLLKMVDVWENIPDTTFLSRISTGIISIPGTVAFRLNSEVFCIVDFIVEAFTKPLLVDKFIIKRIRTTGLDLNQVLERITRFIDETYPLRYGGLLNELQSGQYQVTNNEEQSLDIAGLDPVPYDGTIPESNQGRRWIVNAQLRADFMKKLEVQGIKHHELQVSGRIANLSIKEWQTYGRTRKFIGEARDNWLLIEYKNCKMILTFNQIFMADQAETLIDPVVIVNQRDPPMDPARLINLVIECYIVGIHEKLEGFPLLYSSKMDNLPTNGDIFELKG